MLNWRDPENPLAGGAERVTLGYLSALAARGHEVFWFTFLFPGARPQIQIDGVHILRAGGVGSAIGEAWQWHREQPLFDLVIDQHHGIPWFAPWWCQTRCIAYVHEVLGPIWSAFYGFPADRLGQMQEKWIHWLYRNVPFWTANQATRRALLNHGVRDVTIIPYGVQTSALPELPPKQLTSPIRLVSVSRLAPNKRVDHVIRAVHCLASRGVRASLRIVGHGIHERRLQNLVQELGLSELVSFDGALPEADKDLALKESHLLLHTSQREGWGLNIVEANAMGTPSVVYPVDGLTESTLHRETGLVARSETPEALADAILEMTARPEEYQCYRVRAWERAKSFHWNQVLPRACDWLESMARPQ